MSDELKAALAEEFDKITQEAEETETGPSRDEKGRFQAKAPKEPEEEATEETPAVEQASGEEEITDQGSEPETEPAPQPLSPPDRWSADWKTKFAALPREAQQVLLDREGEYDKGFTQKSQEASELKKRYEPIEQILAPRRQAWAMQGMDEGRAISQLLALSDFAAEKPQEFISWFAQQRGITIPNAPQPGAETPQAPLTPEIAPVLNKVQNLEQRIQTWQQAETNRQIDAFRSAPGHEHFDEVRGEMGKLLNAGIATSMEDAYQKACLVNQGVKQKIEAANIAKAEEARKAEEAKRKAEAQAAALKAKKAAGVQVTPKATLNGGAPAPSSMKESLTQAWDQIHGAA